MRRIIIIAAGIAALFSLACGAEESVFEGRVQHYVLDGHDGHARAHLLLQLGHDEGVTTELRFSGGAPALVSGARLRVWGHFLPREPLELGTRPPLAVTRFEEIGASPEDRRAQAIVVAPDRAPPPRKLLVILMNFANDQRQPVTVDEVRRKIFTGPDSTRAFFREQSYGVVDLQGKTGPAGDVYGWYTIAAANRPCSAAAWGEAALAAARTAGVDTTGYDNTVFFFPATDACPYLGLGQQPGKLTWINGASFATFNHELGHNLGTPHAGARVCFDARGQRATIGGSDGTCRDSEYGNPFDVMGAGFRHTHAYNKAQARWLSGGNVIEADRDGVYTLLPQERPSTGVQLLSVLRDQDSYYYLEYRQPFGFDDFAAGAPAVSGVIVVLGNHTRQLGRSMLLDMTPETTTFDDAPLAVGKTFEDRAAGVRITLLERNAEGAKVEVKLSAPGGTNGGDAGPFDAADAANDARDGGAAGPDGAGVGEAPGAGGTTGAGATMTTGGAMGAAGAGGARPAVVNPAPPPPPPVSHGCSYAGARSTPPVTLLLLVAAPLAWARRRRSRGLRRGSIVLLLALACSTKGLPPPNSQRSSEPASTGGTSQTGGGGAGGAESDARPVETGGSDAVAEAGARDGIGRDTTADQASDLPLPPAPELVLPMGSAEAASACTAYGAVMCARLRDCTPRRLRVDYGDWDLCVARHTRACLIDLGNPSRLELPRDRTNCIRALDAQSCRDFALGFALDACQPKGGAQGRGAACSNNGVCSANLRCKIDADVCGTCQPAIREGGDCGWWASGCMFGTACYDDRCLAPLKVGQTCQNTSAPCEPGLAGTATGCRPRTAGAGASCAEADLCDPLQDLFCNLTTKLCEALPPPVKADERCETYSPAGAWLTCDEDATCVASSSAVTAPRTCIPKVDVGGACDVNAGKSCKAPAICTRGVCVVPKIVMGGPLPVTTCK